MTIYTSIPNGYPINPIHINAGFIYGYDAVRDQLPAGQYNPDNSSRINQYGKRVTCAQEIDKAFTGLELQYKYFNGYNQNPLIIMLVCNTALTTDQQTLLNTTIANHKANIIGDKYGIKKADGTYAMDEAIPTQLDLFATIDEAQQCIILEGYTGAIAVPVVIL
jgi:hypothetical protein